MVKQVDLSESSLYIGYASNKAKEPQKDTPLGKNGRNICTVVTMNTLVPCLNS